jgi:alpha-L-fucosidase
MTPIPLWPAGRVPGALGTADTDVPTITIYKPDVGKANGAAVVVCPGGGYGALADHEGAPVAQWLNTLGVTGFVLRYRLGPRYRHPVMGGDAARALRWVRTHAAEHALDPGRVGILGFSAGGHLASTAATHFDDGKPGDADPVEQHSSRPNVAILIYPVVTLAAAVRARRLAAQPARRQSAGRTRPLFVQRDAGHEGNAADLSAAHARRRGRARRKQPAFSRSPFAKRACRSRCTCTSTARTASAWAEATPVLSGWPALCAAWLKGRGFLAAREPRNEARRGVFFPAHALVARREVRHVRPLGPVRDPGRRMEGPKVPGIGEWIMDNAKIPIPEYEALAAQFNPVKFDARTWARTAKNAGMRYLVITSKHHDGFSLFGTRVNRYNIVDATPFRRDPLRELAAACRAEGVKFGFYYSIMDWHHPYANDRNAPRYIAQMREQLRELVTRYDPAILWFDGEWVSWWNEQKGRELEAFVRSLKPGIVINNRVGKRKTTDGDYETPEQEIPKEALGTRLWETCMTLNDTWGYKKDDHNWKSPDDVIRKLADIASKGGNFLLNVGPTAEGRHPRPVGADFTGGGPLAPVNGEAIYGTTFAPPDLPQPTWGAITRKGDRCTRSSGLDLRRGGLKPRLIPRALTGPAARSKARSGDPEPPTGRGLSCSPPAPPPTAHASVIFLEGLRAFGTRRSGGLISVILSTKCVVCSLPATFPASLAFSSWFAPCLLSGDAVKKYLCRRRRA